MAVAKFRIPGTEQYIAKIQYRFENVSVHNRSEKQLRLDLIHIEPEFRGRGFGKQIVEYVIGKAKKLGCKCVVISMTKEGYNYYSSYDKRKKFFERIGFQFDKEGNYARFDINNEKTEEHLKGMSQTGNTNLAEAPTSIEVWKATDNIFEAKSKNESPKEVIQNNSPLTPVKEPVREIVPLVIKLDSTVTIKSLEELLNVLSKIPPDSVEKVITQDVTRSIIKWVSDTYPDKIILQSKLKDRKGFTPQQTFEKMIRSLRGLSEKEGK
jgi:predicted GNAT family acetyltransferase